MTPLGVTEDSAPCPDRFRLTLIRVCSSSRYERQRPDRRERLAARETTVAQLVGEAVGHRRSTAGLSVADLAERACIPARAVAVAEAGRAVLTVEALVAVARVLGISAAELVRSVPPVAYERTPLHAESRWSPIVGQVPSVPPSDIRGAVGATLRNVRRTRRPLDLIARDAGMDHSAVTRVEQGEANVDVATLVHLADACEVRLASLLERAGL